MTDRIFVRKGDEQFGPYDEQTLQTLIRDGQFSGQDMAWHETSGDWKPLDQILDLRTAAPTTSPLPGVKLAASGPEAAPGQPQQVVITGIEMRFIDIVILIVKIALASVPAMILIWILMAIISLIFGALFGSFFLFHHH